MSMRFTALLLTMLLTSIGLGSTSSLPAQQTQPKNQPKNQAGNSTDQTKSVAKEPSLLDQLVGTWRMEGRGRASPDASWYRTASTMVASRRLKDRALIREIDAPAIQMSAMDILWLNNETDEYTYLYLASNRPAPIVMIGEATDDQEITVYLEEPESRTVIRLVSDNEMVAQDFRVDENGDEWMSREVKHYREPKRASP